MGRVAPNRQEAQGLKTSVNKRKQQGTFLLRGIIIGMLCGLVVAFGALGGLSLLMGSPVDQHAQVPSAAPALAALAPMAPGGADQFSVAVPPLSPVKDRSKLVGPKLMARAPKNPQRWSGRLEVLALSLPVFAAAPKQTVPRHAWQSANVRAGISDSLASLSLYSALSESMAIETQDTKPSNAFKEFATAITSQRQTNGVGVVRGSPSRQTFDGATPALVQFAQYNEIDTNKPKMAIILLDDGTETVDLDILAAFPYPITFALDATRPGAVAAMQMYRKRGFEVVVIADFTPGITAEEAQIKLQNDLRKLPHAVAVIETQQRDLQVTPAVASRIAQLLKRTGHGLILFPQELNVTRRLARKMGVPAASVFRDFDSKNQDSRIIRSFLDQAALRAHSESGVIMIGRLRAETIKALVLWGLQDRAGRVALTPISSILLAKIDN
jgi:polysaccharide deacetylase 2 family uncharacterized protein YibQ